MGAGDIPVGDASAHGPLTCREIAHLEEKSEELVRLGAPSRVFGNTNAAPGGAFTSNPVMATGHAGEFINDDETLETRQYEREKGKTHIMLRWMNRGSVFAALMASIILFGCDKEGPMERAGEKIDQAVEKAGDQVENATNR